MKDERKNIREPFQPENTPNPPQIIDPSKRNEEGKREAPIENKQSDKGNSQSENPKLEKPKKQGENEPDIQGETTN